MSLAARIEMTTSLSSWYVVLLEDIKGSGYHGTLPSRTLQRTSRS